jgi:hypothetical protein
MTCFSTCENLIDLWTGSVISPAKSIMVAALEEREDLNFELTIEFGVGIASSKLLQ